MDTQQSWPLTGIFDYAADLIETHGHTIDEFWQGSRSVWDRQPMCIEGALRVADMLIHGHDMTTGHRYSQLYRDALAFAHRMVPAEYITVINYNDGACDKGMAITFLRDCATKTRPDEARG